MFVYATVQKPTNSTLMCIKVIALLTVPHSSHLLDPKMLKGLALLAALLIVSAEAGPNKRLNLYAQSNDVAEEMDKVSMMETDGSEEANDNAEMTFNEATNLGSEDDAADRMLNFMASRYLNPTGVEDIDQVYEEGQLSCSLCQKAVKFAVPKIAKYGCNFLFKAQAVAACLAIGLGPEDPLTYVCSALLIGSCTVIAGKVAQKVTDPAKICQAIRSC